MTLRFPNRSRSYDETHRGVRFVGHDGMFEIPFFIENDALSANADSDVESERRYLEAFDAALASIQDAASKSYYRTRQNRYVLTADDFK